MTHPERYYYVAKELQNLLDTLRSNLQFHAHVLQHGDPDKVIYAMNLPRSWNNHPDRAQRQTNMTDPVEWPRDVRRDSDHCLEDFERFSEEMQKMNGNNDRKLNAAIQCMTDFLRGANGPVRVHTNGIKANCKVGGCLPQDEKNLYEFASSRLRPGHQSKIWPFTPKTGQFDSME